jgi:hypothetical protein
MQPQQNDGEEQQGEQPANAQEILERIAARTPPTLPSIEMFLYVLYNITNDVKIPWSTLPLSICGFDLPVLLHDPRPLWSGVRLGE